MEIERKWMVKGWPEESEQLTLLEEHFMRQGYISTRPTVRIREEAKKGGDTAYILCFKSPGFSGGLSREEIEIPVSKEHFEQLERLIGIPLICKERRTWLLPDGLRLEVNLVDKDLPFEFMYAEVEFESEQQAREWDPASVGLADYLDDDVTGQPGQTMGAFWEITRVQGS